MRLASRAIFVVSGFTLALSLILALGASTWEVLHSSIYTHAVDFGYYRQYALLVLQHGWSAYYSPQPDPSLPLNINPPLLVAFALPFLPFSPQVGFIAWTLLSLLALGFAWWLASLRHPYWQLALILSSFPVVYNLLLGQPVLFIVAIVALAWWLSERHHPIASGAILALATIKPQLVFLLPVVFLFSGRWREVLGFALSSLFLLGVSLLLVSPSGLNQLAQNLHAVLLHSHTNYIIPAMVVTLLVPSWPGYVLSALTLVAVCSLAYRAHRAPTATIYAIGLLASLLLTPYLHPQDLCLWLLAALLLSRTSPVPALAYALGLLACWSWIILSGVLFPPLVPHLAWLPLVPATSALGLILAWRSLSNPPASTNTSSRPHPVPAPLRPSSITQPAR